MVKVAPRDINRVVNNLDPNIRAILIFGRDEGLVREYAEKIGKQVVEDLNDPFNVARPSPGDLKENPSLLLDEVAALSMMGGRRLVRLEQAGNDVKAAVELVLKSDQGDGLLLITGGDMKTTSGLPKLFDKAKNALVITCYEDDKGSLMGLVQEVLAANGLGATQDAVAYLCDHLGSDRMVSRGELEKLATYMGPDGGQVTIDDAEACVGDTAALGLHEIAEAVTGGKMQRLEVVLERAWTAQESPIAILRTLQSRLQRLHLARGHMDQGQNAAGAMGKLQPPVFFKDKPAFTAELQRWSVSKIDQALALVLEAEQDCKTTGNPAEVICSRLLLRIAKAAG